MRCVRKGGFLKKSLLEIYALVVCLITLVCIVFISGAGIYNIISIASPRLTIAGYTYSKYISNDGYKYEYGKEREDLKGLSEEEVTKKRTAALEVALIEEQRSAGSELIKNVIALLLNSIVFAFHWVLAKRARLNY